MPEDKLIGPVEVARDENGFWWHPGIPAFDGGEDPAPYHAWLKEQGLELTYWGMDSDLDSHPYYNGSAAHCIGWDPEAPGPEWFLLGIFDTEDGPHVHWARLTSEGRVKAAQAWLKGIEQEYGQEAADKCEDILMEAEARKQAAP
ncbi:hypothetical protein [Pseudomonas sp. PSE1(2024)]|uniref:hypothetical protein n=1 Tax=Pseudomonas sp. PSE1(2024) TaxID=3228746 RepID=UPI003D96E739